MSSPGLARAADAAGADLGTSRLVAAVAVGGAAVLLAGVVVSARGPAPEDLPTVLRAASAGTVLELPDAAPRAAREGDRVPDGATIRTPSGGAARLDTGGREVDLAGATAVRVLDGTHQDLRSGSLLVDTHSGPRVRVAAAAADVEVPGNAMVRLDRAAVLRVASYTGTAVLRTGGRQARAGVARLHQVQVPPGGMPGRITPLALTPADPWERDHLSAVVDTDHELAGLVQSLDGSAVGARAVSAVPAEFLAESADDTSPLATGARTMTFAIARASGDPERTYRQVLDGRELGGSWGVLSALVDAPTDEVLGFFDGTLPGALAAVAQDEADARALAVGDPDSAEVVAGLLDEPADAPAVHRPTAGPSRRPTTAPSAAPSPVDVPDQVPDPVEDPAEETLREVLRLLPSPSPSPSATRLPVLRLPARSTPTPLPALPDLLPGR